MSAQGRRTSTVRRRLVAGIAALAATATVGVLLPAPADATTTPPPRRLVTGWGYFNTTSASALTSLQANADLFSDISPFWYSARWSGTASSIRAESYAANRDTVLPLIKAAGVAVLPTITDGMAAHRMSTVLGSASTRTALVNQIVATVMTEGYDGIDLDFEGFAFSDGSSTWSTTRPRWVAFVKQLYSALHAKNKLLSITTPPLYTATTGYWVYDWKAIGPYVDRLRVMTYDYSTSKAGPISPYAWVSKVAAFAVTQVASGKVQIGVPNYGRGRGHGHRVQRGHRPLPDDGSGGREPDGGHAFRRRPVLRAVEAHVHRCGSRELPSRRSPARSSPDRGSRSSRSPSPPGTPPTRSARSRTKVSFSGTRSHKVTTNGAAAASLTVTVASTTGLVNGLSVAGSAIPAGTKVASFNATSKVVTLTGPTSGAFTGASLTFSGAVPAVCSITRLGYYDDASSAVARASLVGTYHLRGIAEWTIGGEDPTSGPGCAATPAPSRRSPPPSASRLRRTGPTACRSRWSSALARTGFP